MLVLLSSYEVLGQILTEENGRPLEIGDSVRLYLDRTTYPDLPEYVNAKITDVRTNRRLLGVCQTPVSYYQFQYDTDDLPGGTPLILGNLLRVEYITCCDRIEEIGVIANEALSLAEVPRAVNLEEAPVSSLLDSYNILNPTDVNTGVTAFNALLTSNFFFAGNYPGSVTSFTTDGQNPTTPTGERLILYRDAGRWFLAGAFGSSVSVLWRSTPAINALSPVGLSWENIGAISGLPQIGDNYLPAVPADAKLGQLFFWQETPIDPIQVYVCNSVAPIHFIELATVF